MKLPLLYILLFLASCSEQDNKQAIIDKIESNKHEINKLGSHIFEIQLAERRHGFQNGLRVGEGKERLPDSINYLHEKMELQIKAGRLSRENDSLTLVLQK